MRSFRIIPCLLVKGAGMYKTVGFTNAKYIGDSVNTIKLFNDKEVDEVLVFDIDATGNHAEPNFSLIETLASECFAPLAYGGGITNMQQIEKIFALGIEKISLGVSAFQNPDLVKQAVKVFGSQSVVVCVDFAKNIFGKYVLAPHGKKTSISVIDYVHRVEQLGAGEIILNDVKRDGTGRGLDRLLIEAVTKKLSIPVVACGGAQSVEDLVQTACRTGVAAVGAGSLFVYYGERRSVLINYPTESEIDKLLLEMKG